MQPTQYNQQGQPNQQLLQALLCGDPPLFDPYSGQNIAECEQHGTPLKLHRGAVAGLDVPRFCQLCGRRMVVQVRPDGWQARCSRHGAVDSEDVFVETFPPDRLS